MVIKPMKSLLKSIAFLVCTICFLLCANMITTGMAGLIKLTWDMNDPGQRVLGYNVYEKSGTNWVRVGSTTNTLYILDVIPGAHTFSVTATNFWRESPFSAPASTPLDCTSPVGLTIQKLPDVMLRITLPSAQVEPPKPRVNKRIRLTRWD